MDWSLTIHTGLLTAEGQTGVRLLVSYVRIFIFSYLHISQTSLQIGNHEIGWEGTPGLPELVSNLNGQLNTHNLKKKKKKKKKNLAVGGY